MKSTSHTHVLTPWSIQGQSWAPLIASGDGPYLIEQSGRRILDFSSGWAATQLGHSHPTVIMAMQAQMKKICWAPPNFSVDVREDYAAAISEISPWPEGCRVHFTTGGGEANDDAARIARMLTGRSKILAAYRSYHGNTQGAAALTGSLRRWVTEPHASSNVVRFWAPYPYRSPFFTTDPQEECARALAQLEMVLAQEGASRIAALFIEPVLGSEGVVVYPNGYLQGVRELTARHGILLVFDEVVTGFGRVGESFAANRFKIEPDLVTFAKGSSTSYVPLGGVLIREGLADRFDSQLFDVGHTHSGHPLAMAAGLGTLQALREENLFSKAYEIEAWLREDLSALAEKHQVIGDVRGIGAYFALELVRDRATREPLVSWQSDDSSLTKRWFADLLASGLWVHGKYNVAVIAPPLVISRQQVRDGVAILDQCLSRLESQ